VFLLILRRRAMRTAPFAALLLMTACSRAPLPLADPDLAAEIARIRTRNNSIDRIIFLDINLMSVYK